MSLEKLREVVQSNLGLIYTIRIRDEKDLTVVTDLLDSFNYKCAEPDDWYKNLIAGRDYQVVCVYRDFRYMSHNHSCLETCLFDFTEE